MSKPREPKGAPPPGRLPPDLALSPPSPFALSPLLYTFHTSFFHVSVSENPKLTLWLSFLRGGEGSGAPPHPVRGSTWHRVSFHTTGTMDTVRQPKKERQACNNDGSLSGHIHLNRSTSCTTHPTAHLP